MWKITTVAGAVNFIHLSRVHVVTPSRPYSFKGKLYNYAVESDLGVLEYFDNEADAHAYVEKLVEELNHFDKN